MAINPYIEENLRKNDFVGSVEIPRRNGFGNYRCLRETMRKMNVLHVIYVMLEDDLNEK